MVKKTKRPDYFIELMLVPPPFPARMVQDDGSIREEPEQPPPRIIQTVYPGTADEYIRKNYPAAVAKGSEWRVYKIRDVPLSDLEQIKPAAEKKKEPS